jgi:hypothetical protein
VALPLGLTSFFLFLVFDCSDTLDNPSEDHSSINEANHEDLLV